MRHCSFSTKSCYQYHWQYDCHQVNTSNFKNNKKILPSYMRLVRNWLPKIGQAGSSLLHLPFGPGKRWTVCRPCQCLRFRHRGSQGRVRAWKFAERSGRCLTISSGSLEHRILSTFICIHEDQNGISCPIHRKFYLATYWIWLCTV